MERTAISALLDSIRAARPELTALYDGRQTFTYGELAEAIGSEGRWLAASGGRRFALLAANGCPWAVSDLALHEARALNVPLPAWFTPDQLVHALTDAAIDSVLTDEPDRIRELALGFELARQSAMTGLTLMQRSAAVLPSYAAGAGVTKITYTSGSTSEPKGVCLSAATLERVAQSIATVTAPAGIERHLCLMPLPTLLENIAGIYAPLLTGASCAIPPASVTGMSYGGVDPQRLITSIVAAQPESLILVPELLRLLVAAVDRGWEPPRALRFIAVGGATVSSSLLEHAAAVGLPVFEGYGLSECASVVCLNTPVAQRKGSVGRALPHAALRCDAGGQIHVRGAVMDGYLGAPPVAGDEIATGDIGEIDDDGFVYVRGRMRNVFITSLGRNVSPEWVERELTREPTIRYALVHGEAQPFAAALLVPALSPSAHEDIAEAVARANARLPDYARVYRWVLLPELPTIANGMLTANGRLRRTHVLARHGGLLDELFSEPLTARIRRRMAS